MTDSRRVEPVETSHREPATLALISSTPLNADDLDAFVLDSVNGALVTFRGIVRDHDHGQAVTSLEYEAHPEAQRFLEECCSEVATASGLRVAAAHRTGHLVVGEVALVASVAAPHRAEAFAACEQLVELIKQRVPIWKRQHMADGVTEWVGL